MGIIIEKSSGNIFSVIQVKDNSIGISIRYGSSNKILDVNVTNSNTSIVIQESVNNSISGTILYNNSFGLVLVNSENNIITSNIIQNNNYGIFLESSKNNKIYNNLFNNTNNTYFEESYKNYWNANKQAGTRIYSNGLEIGGNYWTNSSGNGYSDTCQDNNKDGFCDSPYVLDPEVGNNTDYYPLSNKYEVYCGNGYCESGESCSSCSRDCGACPPPVGVSPGPGAPLTTVTTTPGKAVIFIPLIAAMSKANVSIQKTEGIDFTQIVISVKNRVTSVFINITKLDAKPEEVPALVNVYRYVRVDKKNIRDEDVEEVKIRFKVGKSWISLNNIIQDSIALYRYTNKWEKLNTVRIGEDTENIYFEATSPGLSYFAIAGEKAKQACPYECCVGEVEYYDKPCASGYRCENHVCVAIVTPCVEDWVCTEWSDCIGGKQTRVCTDRNRCGTVTNKPEEERECEVKPEEKLPTLVFWLGIIVFVIVIFVVAKMIFKRKPELEKKPKVEEKPRKKERLEK
ncbi:MAG: PGF-pre-PGF domain-containing protein [Candidatus Aenigmarchaeota archaeon]|nr:PGF-pre-PGF domain-containing protein [Candidatus Aenigmarchaeota archaeon]